jgi:hypothetical protein
VRILAVEAATCGALGVTLTAQAFCRISPINDRCYESPKQQGPNPTAKIRSDCTQRHVCQAKATPPCVRNQTNIGRH